MGILLNRVSNTNYLAYTSCKVRWGGIIIIIVKTTKIITIIIIIIISCGGWKTKAGVWKYKEMHSI